MTEAVRLALHVASRLHLLVSEIELRDHAKKDDDDDDDDDEDAEAPPKAKAKRAAQ